MKKIAVIGVGTAGIQSVCHFLCYLNKDWQVTSIYDPSIPIVGIGESTNPIFVETIEKALNFDLYESLIKEDIDCTIKIGTYYKGWRKKDFMNPFIQGSLAIHFNTFKFQEFAFPKLREKWGSKFKELPGTLLELKNNGNKATAVLKDQGEFDFDYIIDCRGFPKNYDDYILIDNPTNRCLVHNIEEPANWLYTGHKATRDGWMFEVPLTSRQSYGYLFNDSITDINQARKNFAEDLGLQESQLQNIEFKFKSYYAVQLFDGRICKNGNLAVFFEPMFANSLWLYDNINRILYDHIIGNLTMNQVNANFHLRAKAVEDMINYMYHGGSLFDTPFWAHAKDYCSEQVLNCKNFNITKEKMKIVSENNTYEDRYSWVFLISALQALDRNFEYNYFPSMELK